LKQQYSLEIHANGEEDMLSFASIPDSSIINFDATIATGMSITIKEWITEALNSDYDPCTSDWNMQGYIWCLGKFLCAEVDQNTNETCKKWYKDLSKINRDFGTELLDVFKNKSCPKNCRSYVYTESHQFRYKPSIDDHFEITISKPAFRIRVDAEVEAMKLWDFISSFGGNLGLFLGGSIVWMSEKIFIQLPNSMQKFRST